MDCPGCESKIKQALHNVKGVDEVDIDMGLQKVTVTGWADQKKVLKTVRKTGRRAELWQFPYNPETRSRNFTGHHYHYQNNYGGPSTYYAAQPAASCYNYYKHGYDSHVGAPTYYAGAGNSAVYGNRMGDTFSDENPNACSIM
ncbi:UNVERIFIED_CONTAM: Heavy metal-associated isoprenylated plant protein 28 [Sesamum radiatum]|uniref:Heavy metal-associated isoprenylated plant protein 28 n=1 Tax=Sesamum radiatum TaxID=300843 RepID=A0AAW2K4H7_SESRA